MRPLAIVDYGMGNLRSVEKAFERLGHAAHVTRDPERIARAPGVVLPGVGAFGACMTNVTARGLVAPETNAIQSGRPFSGICLGMQLMYAVGERQRLRLSVPPREEPAGGPPAARQLRAPARMIVYPAIDLRGGRCVRLLEGAFERETVYGDDPVAVARGFEAAGAGWLHVVDL